LAHGPLLLIIERLNADYSTVKRRMTIGNAGCDGINWRLIANALIERPVLDFRVPVE
jgi:hypothetical protein